MQPVQEKRRCGLGASHCRHCHILHNVNASIPANRTRIFRVRLFGFRQQNRIFPILCNRDVGKKAFRPSPETNGQCLFLGRNTFGIFRHHNICTAPRTRSRPHPHPISIGNRLLGRGNCVYVFPQISGFVRVKHATGQNLAIRRAPHFGHLSVALPFPAKRLECRRPIFCRLSEQPNFRIVSFALAGYIGDWNMLACKQHHQAEPIFGTLALWRKTSIRRAYFFTTICMAVSPRRSPAT